MKIKYAVLSMVTLVTASVGLWAEQPQAKAQCEDMVRDSRIERPTPTNDILAHKLAARTGSTLTQQHPTSPKASTPGNESSAPKAQQEKSTAPAGQTQTTQTQSVSTANVNQTTTTSTANAAQAQANTSQATSTQSQPAPSQPRSSGPSISFMGVTMPVIQGSMSATTAPAGDLVETWGGQTRLSVTDGQSTHIIGHNTSSFGNIIKMGIGSPITITDVNGQVKTYYVTAVADVNDQGYDVHTGQDEWEHIVSAGQGEQIVLQTCLSDTVNRLVWAR